ncbi:plasmid mobilization protein [Gellertiella hungarica]|uniref:Bacterial mobilisation domain-containing protein n=1 Tax=Gellertiella hungarica TaxID=1572859 RepID=A0A7W6J9T1_9HYPH|nr:plasmid mobilization relaxosome protein MobC [Gellertiella hungarica]MBB4067424.1 hypothetical protein [Gellertiella hungarica]
MGSERRKTTELVTIRVTPDDHARIVEAGAAHGLGPSSFARVAVCQAVGLAAPDVRRKPDPKQRDLARILGELGRIGSNVNQVARVANATGDVASLVAVDALRDQLEELTRAVLELR